MQKAYKLYFSANLQLVIGKDSNNKKKKKILCVTCPSPHPKLKWREKQNKTKTEELQMTLESFRNHYFQLKNFNTLRNQ